MFGFLTFFDLTSLSCQHNRYSLTYVRGLYEMLGKIGGARCSHKYIKRKISSLDQCTANQCSHDGSSYVKAFSARVFRCPLGYGANDVKCIRSTLLGSL